MSERKTVDIGQRFGKLVVISEAYSHNQRMYCDCCCDCGKVGRKMLRYLYGGRSKSCGCNAPERLKKIMRGRFGKKHPQFNGCGEIHGFVWWQIKRNADLREISFEITVQEAWELFLKQDRKCALTGLPLQFPESKERLSERTASLDRISSNGCYVVNNVQWVHKQVNHMKHTCSNVELWEWCERILLHKGWKITRT